MPSQDEDEDALSYTRPWLPSPFSIKSEAVTQSGGRHLLLVCLLSLSLSPPIVIREKESDLGDTGERRRKTKEEDEDEDEEISLARRSTPIGEGGKEYLSSIPAE